MQLQKFHDLNGHLAEFAGYNLPLWYTGIIPESLAVRNAAGMFDVSHMGRAIIRGRESCEFLDKITTNDVSSMEVAQGQYSLICNAEGGIMDDVVVFHLHPNEYLIVYNAGNRSKDYNWILENAKSYNIDVQNISDQVAMFAVQGPKARETVQTISAANLQSVPRFGSAWTELNRTKALVTRTGYTGEDGFEIYVWDSPLDNPTKAQAVWDAIMEAGKPYGLKLCGLGARDLLRLEAGLCLYGNEMDECTNPFEAKLGFAVKLQKDFVGKEKLVRFKEKGTLRVRIGLVMQNKAIPRHGHEIAVNGGSAGRVTSGTFSPLVNTGIAMGYVEKSTAIDGFIVEVQIRSRAEKAKIVKPPFYDLNRYGYARRISSSA